MNDKKILIVSYRLGTKDGVGGRRWLFYGLELLRKGYDVKFLTYQQDLPAELFPYKDKVQILKTNYPVSLRAYPETFFSKLMYRLSYHWLKVINSGSVYDEAVRTEKDFLSAASKIIEVENRTNVFITGAPFSLLYFGTLLKKKFPGILLVSDYRDNWTKGHGYGIKELPPQKFKFELDRELAVLKESDFITVPSADIMNSLKDLNKEARFMILPNFSDVKQFANKAEHKVLNKKNEIVLTHLGSVNNHLKKYWENLIRNVQYVNEHKGMNVSINFIGNSLGNKDLENYVNEHKVSFVKFTPRVYKNELAFHLNDADLMFFFKMDAFPDTFPTKFFDYIVFHKPLLCYSKEGEVTKEIRENRIGFVLNENTSNEEFFKIIDACYKGSFGFNKEYDWSKFSLEAQVEQIEQLIIKN